MKFYNKKTWQLCSSILSPKDDDGNFLRGQKAVEKLKRKKFNIVNKPELYESNIYPILRFLHIRDITSCGWITLPAKKFSVNKSKLKNSHCRLDLITKWGNINHYENF